MGDLAKLKIWDDPVIRDALSLDVAENRRPAKFRIAATVATQLDPAASSEDALWAELGRLTPISLVRWQGVRAGASLPQADGASLLELCRRARLRKVVVPGAAAMLRVGAPAQSVSTTFPKFCRSAM
jgi:putative pyruvate formate lyase activating enzyme